MNVLAVAVSGRGLVDPHSPVFSADDEALLRGRAVFETARVYGGRPFMLEAHVERLARSAARVRLPEPDAAECMRLADGVIKSAGVADLSLRFYWTGQTLVSTGAAIPPEIEELRARGLRLAVVRWSTGAGYDVEEGAFPLDRLLAADEAFLTSSVREVMPVAAVDATAFELGAAAHALQLALRSRT